MKNVLRIALTLAAGLMLGCATDLPGPQSDRDIAAEVLDRLESDTATARQNIGVAVTEGVVTLNGRIANPNVRLRAKALARGTEGVKGVVDNLGND